MRRLTPREVLIGGLCALAYPICLHVAARLLGRNVLDPHYRQEHHP